jgi:hypothetical protein
MKMQAFYTQLSHALEVYNPNLAHLAALTRISPQQAGVLKTEMSWNEWPAATV